MNDRKIINFLKGTSKVLEVLAKEVEKDGLDEGKIKLIKRIASDLLFKGCTWEITK